TGTSLFDSKLKIDIRGIFNPYKTDSTGNRVVNSYILNDWEQPARLTDLSLSTSISFSSSELKSKKEDGKKTEQTTEEGDDNSIPWNLNIGYSLTYEHINPYKKYSIIHSCTFSGSLTLTKNWKLGIQSGYDFTNKEFNMTSINITRDLHCWQMTFNVIPFGSMQSYSFNISAKAAILQDLKYSKVNQSWRGRY
ncbi:MAG TPA: LPS-assembly protein LptD, partial [Bacteroidales bacterium]